MSEANPFMAMLLDHNSFLGASETIESEIQPIDAQYRFGVGDTAMLAQANTPMERDFVLVKCIDASEHAEMFPDWEERLMNSFVLCEVFSKSDPQVHLGWVSRLKVMPIAKYRYKEARRWIGKKGEWPDALPDWVIKYHEKYTQELAKQAPHVIPLTVECPNCGSHDVHLIARRHLTYTAKAGMLTVDDRGRGTEDLIVPINDVEEESTHTAQLQCQDCQSTADLEDHEWILPGISQ